MIKSLSTKKHFLFLGLIAGCIFWSSCGKTKNVPNTDNIHVNVEIKRFDHTFYKMKGKVTYQKLLQLRKEYPYFLDDYVGKLLQIGRINDEYTIQTLNNILIGRPFADLQHDVDSVFHDISDTREKITDAFKLVKYYYPDFVVPKIITYTSGFQMQIALGNGYVGVGLDMFLGSKSRFYPALIKQIPLYISRRFVPENITPRIIEAIVSEEFCRPPSKDKSLLAYIVYYGKILYAMEQFLPYTDESILIGYSEKQMQWAKKFEADIWGQFIKENLLYETDFNLIRKYVSEAPFTQGFGEEAESAPRFAHFIGWQMIRKVMKNNPNYTLPQLMRETDVEKLLKMSKYNP